MTTIIDKKYTFKTLNESAEISMAIFEPESDSEDFTTAFHIAQEDWEFMGQPEHIHVSWWTTHTGE